MELHVCGDYIKNVLIKCSNSIILGLSDNIFI